MRGQQTLDRGSLIPRHDASTEMIINRTACRACAFARRPLKSLVPRRSRMAATIEEKYGIIRERDERFAFELAKAIMDKPKASIWIIFLPMLFVFHAHWLQRYKKSIQTFSRQYLHSKLLALDTVLEESRGGNPLEGGWASTYASLPEARGGVFTEWQVKELDLLRDHYHLLIASQGRDYPALIRNAYRTSGEYRFFLNSLYRAEEEINKAVLQIHHPTPEARDVVERMERSSETLREMELAQIFGSLSRP
jgi:hypothetical protein